MSGTTGASIGRTTMPPVDVIVATYQSAPTLSLALASFEGSFHQLRSW